MHRITGVSLLLAATILTLASCKFDEWRHLDLIDRVDFTTRYRPGFKIEVMFDPCRHSTTRPRAKSGDYMYQNYYGRLVDGTLFDSSYSRGNTYNFYLGTGVVIYGMDMGMKGMCVGEKRRITIPPSLGYGSRQIGKIPPHSTLVFEVTLENSWVGPTGHEVISKPAKCERLTAPGDLITIHYNGTLENGVPFYSTYANSAINVTVGGGNAVQGLDMNLLDMCVGEVRKINVHNLLAYGDRGHGSTIPPKANLVFETVLVDIIKGKHQYIKIDGENCPANKRVFNKDILEIEYSGESVTGRRARNIGRRFKFQVGSAQIPTGLTWGVNSMCIGERRRILMPPEFVDRDFDNAGFPVNKRLTLDIKLLSNNFGVAPSTLAPSTLPPSTLPPSTLPPSTLPPTTGPPTTRPPTTRPPTTRLPTTRLPTTRLPATHAPVTQAPVTHAPVTHAPVTHAPVTHAPVTHAPVTHVPTTHPTTRRPTTRRPTTIRPTTRPPVTQPLKPMMKACGGKSPSSQHLDQWCYVNCNHPIPYCPASHCVCV